MLVKLKLELRCGYRTHDAGYRPCGVDRIADKKTTICRALRACRLRTVQSAWPNPMITKGMSGPAGDVYSCRPSEEVFLITKAACALLNVLDGRGDIGVVVWEGWLGGKVSMGTNTFSAAVRQE